MKRLLFLILFVGCVPSLALAQATGSARLVTATPTVDTSAYASGDLVGTKLTWTNALKPITGTGYVVSVNMIDQSAQAVDFDIVIFREDPTSTTFTDNAAFDIADADTSKVIAVVPLASASRFAFNDNSVHFSGSLAIPVWGTNSNGGISGTLYGAIIARGAATFAASTDVKVTLGMSRD